MEANDNPNGGEGLLDNGTRTLKINMFGGFSLSCGDRCVDDRNSRSRKIWMLLEYLIAFRGKDVSQNDLIELLWRDEDAGDPANTLKTLVHRARSLLDELEFVSGKDMILSDRNGSYCFNNDLPCAIDAEEFEKLCAHPLEADPFTDADLNALMEALALYKGDYLPKNALESWVIPINTYYHSMYLKAVFRAVEALWQHDRPADVASVCQKAASIDPYEESLHYNLIKALVATGKAQAAMRHYEQVTKLFFNEFGVNPSEELTALYKEIVKGSNATQLDLGLIKENMKESTLSQGAYCCEFEFFREMYQVEARAASRTGQAVFICLFTVTDYAGSKPNQKVLATAMERLGEAIQNALRRGDVYARFSVSQYIIMLPTASFENAEKVAKRILKRYNDGNYRLPVTLRYTNQPLDPMM